MDTPLYDALVAHRRGSGSGHRELSTEQIDIARELEACAAFADGTRQGSLVPLAEFTRHRIAKALRDGARTITRLRWNVIAMAGAGVVIIAKERARQVQVEGYRPADDRGRARELMAAAECYIVAARERRATWTERLDEHPTPPPGWPWSRSSWKPNTNSLRNLAKAGALIAAAIDADNAEY